MNKWKRKYEESQKKIQRLQVQLYKGQHDYVLVEVNEVDQCWQDGSSRLEKVLVCSRCEFVKISR